MAKIVVECKNRDALDTFLFGLRFAKSYFGVDGVSGMTAETTKITRGSNETGTLHWLTLEDRASSPDATYRLTKKGLRLYSQGKLV